MFKTLTRWLKSDGKCQEPEVSSRVVSTAKKDAEYYEQLHSLVTNRAFQQEVLEKRTKLAFECSMLPIDTENYARHIVYLQGKIQSLIWVSGILPKINPDKPTMKEL